MYSASAERDEGLRRQTGKGLFTIDRIANGWGISQVDFGGEPAMGSSTGGLWISEDAGDS